MNELTISLELENGVHLYEQIYNHIKEEIIEGKLLAGEKLPSTRFLAEHLQVSRSTVDLAYEQLSSEGYIEARPYKGYYICHVDGLFHMENEVENSISQNEVKTPVDYDFSPHGIDMNYFPFATWKRISKNIYADGDKELFTRGEKQGDLDFRKTICRYLHSARGVNCLPEQVVVGAGNDYLLLLLSRILGGYGSIAMERVTYMRAYYAFEKADFQIKPVEIDNYGMDISSLKSSDADIAYIMPSHQFPTGIVMPIGRRMELLNWASEKEGRYLIEDDYDSEFRYKGKPIPALQASDRNGKVIYMGTFSKSIAPAIRVSFMVLPKELVPRYEETCGFLSCTVSRIDQKILNCFIEEGHYERYLNKMRKVYKGKLDVLLQSLEVLEDRFEIFGENAGLHLLLKSRKAESAFSLQEVAKQQGIQLQIVEDYSIVREKRNSQDAEILLGYGSLSEAEIKEGIQKLKETWSF